MRVHDALTRPPGLAMLGGGNGVEAGSYDAVNGRAQGKGNAHAGSADQERADLRRDGHAELHGRSRGQGRRHPSRRQGQRPDGGARARRRRPRPRAGLRGSAHALRRPDRLGPAPDLLAVARRDHRRHGELRRGRGAGEARDARDPHAGPGERRGHSLRRHEGGHRLAVGELWPVPRCHRPPRAGHQRGRAGGIHAAAPLRHGRGVVRARGDR